MSNKVTTFEIGDIVQYMSLNDQLEEAISLNDLEYKSWVEELIRYQIHPEAVTRQGGVFKIAGTRKKYGGLVYVLESIDDDISTESANLKGFRKYEET